MIDGYLTVNDIAEKWGLFVRTVQILCAEGKVEGATKIGDMWAIPVDAVKPTDGRVTTREYREWRKNFSKSKLE